MVFRHWEFAMPDHILRRVPAIIGAAALFGWVIAYVEALPRLAAGPLCTSRNDLLSLAGHCPACGVAALLSLAFIASIAATRRLAPAPVRARG